jgi:hypothetical protein
MATAKQVAEALRVKFDLPLVRKWGSNGEEIRFVGPEVVVSVDPEFGAETTLVIDWTPGEPVRPEKPKKAQWDPLFKQVLLGILTARWCATGHPVCPGQKCMARGGLETKPISD